MTTREQVVSPKGPTDLPEPKYDVFLSFAGPDRSVGRRLAENLSTSGVRVFFDEKIELFSGITESIREALSESKTLLAYYSTDYARRAACQHELMLAILAGEQEGDPCGRIMVLNPEPHTAHLRPVQLADAKFAITDDEPRRSTPRSAPPCRIRPPRGTRGGWAPSAGSWGATRSSGTSTRRCTWRSSR
jgi:hypothetical protein